MPITDLTGSKWVINENPDVLTTTNFNCSINFTSNNENFTTIENPSGLEELNYIGSFNYTVYDGIESEWSNQAYRTISITGGTDATNPDLISWLQANATQITEQSNTFSIGNLPIANMYFGTRQVKKVYLGNTLVWEKEEPQPSTD